MTPLILQALGNIRSALEDLDVDASDVAVAGDRVVIDRRALASLTGALAYIQGGARVPFVRALIANPGPDGVALSTDESAHLSRALRDIARQL